MENESIEQKQAKALEITAMVKHLVKKHLNDYDLGAAVRKYIIDLK